MSTNFAADDFAYISKRHKEIEEERRRFLEGEDPEGKANGVDIDQAKVKSTPTTVWECGYY